MKIAIITKRGFNSPKVLALGLQNMFSKLGYVSHILEIYDTLARAFSILEKTRYKTRLHYKLKNKMIYLNQDRHVISKLVDFDLFIFCECTPNGFWKGYYNIEYLKKLYPKVPCAYYEVYYLGNAPSHLKLLQENNDYGLERYDWHFAVSDVTEIHSKPKAPWSRIGLDLSYTGLAPTRKDEFIVIVDFAQPGYEENRKAQIAALEEINIKYVALEGRYSFGEIRSIYKKGAVLLIQSSETFGVPMAECLACGCYIATPNSSWPMAWRKGDNLKAKGEGILPECFIVYNDIQGLKTRLIELSQSYDLINTPKQVYYTFYNNYPYFFEGDLSALSESIDSIFKINN